MFWFEITVQTRGAHGAYPHISESANKIAASLIKDLESLTGVAATPPSKIDAVLRRNPDVIERAMGPGAFEVVRKVTVNIGTLRGGLKVNMIPNRCVIEADVRLPVGLEKEPLVDEIKRIVSHYPGVVFRELNFTPPLWCEPEGEMVDFIRANVKALKGFEPVPVVSLGGTDARLWRQRGIPAYVYGPFPHCMGAANEYVEVEEFFHIVKTHVLSAFDYLSH
jgi:succinyl-diaminopimelate desuccinylase